MTDWRNEDEILCHCRNVRAGTVRACIREFEPSRPEELGALCRAGTGCKSCLPDIETIMRQEAALKTGESWWSRLKKRFGGGR